MAKLITTHVIIMLHSCFMVNFCLSDNIHLRTSKFYRSKDEPDDGLTANPTDLSKASLVECALRTMLNTERRFLFNSKTSECIIEEENSFAFNTPVGYARFIHQDIRASENQIEGTENKLKQHETEINDQELPGEGSGWSEKETKSLETTAVDPGSMLSNPPEEAEKEDVPEITSTVSTIADRRTTVDSVTSTRGQTTSNMDSRLAQDVGELRANFPFISDIDPENIQENPSREYTSDQTTSAVHSRMAPNYGDSGSKFPSIGDIIPGDIMNNIQGVLFPKDAKENKPSQDKS